MVLDLADEIIGGRRLSRTDDLTFFALAELKELCRGADRIREKLCGSQVELCSIINGRSGRCSEDCKFCAQSAYHQTNILEYGFLDKETILKDCEMHNKKGVHRYSIVTAGRALEGEDLKKACEVYRKMKQRFSMKLCASHGLLTKEALAVLKESGVEMYHENIETSRRYFPEICSTHSFDDKIRGIIFAHEVGLKVCSGGIIGLGENFEDRIDMALTLAELQVESIPVNILTPLKGTALENMPVLSENEILRTLAMFRYLNPTAAIRMAAGRKFMKDSGVKAFHSGVNATITGDMLTTSGNNIDEDKAMLRNMGFEI